MFGFWDIGQFVKGHQGTFVQEPNVCIVKIPRDLRFGIVRDIPCAVDCDTCCDDAVDDDDPGFDILYVDEYRQPYQIIRDYSYYSYNLHFLETMFAYQLDIGANYNPYPLFQLEG